MQEYVYKGKATLLINGDLGDSHRHGPALIPSAPVCLQVTRWGKGWAPALHKLSPSPRMPLASLGHHWHHHNGTPAPAGVQVSASEQDSYAPRSLPLKYGQSSQVLPCWDFWMCRQDRFIQTSIRLENLGNPSASTLKSNAYSNCVERGQRSSLMIKSIIQWLQFAPTRKLQA